MGAVLYFLCPGIAFGLGYFTCYGQFKRMNERVGGIGGAEMVTLTYELDCGGWEVRDVIWDMTSGNEMLSGGEEDFAKLGFTGTCRGGELKLSEGLLCFPGE